VAEPLGERLTPLDHVASDVPVPQHVAARTSDQRVALLGVPVHGDVELDAPSTIVPDLPDRQERGARGAGCVGRVRDGPPREICHIARAQRTR